jgi:metallo-beta-lactamase family protein
MNIKISFLGAAQNVTGSRYRIEANNTVFQVDCGLYQEREFRERNWHPYAYPSEHIDAVVLTHAHLDHCGLLPKLVKNGFRGPIHCTAATADIAEIVLLDSAKIQMEDAEFKRRRHKREKRKGPYPEVPLYETEDANATISQFSPIEYDKTTNIGNGVDVTLHDAGHILGSSIAKIKIRQNGEERTILFSGDLGRWDKPILRDPTIFEEADYIVVESTYGNRQLETLEDGASKIADIINETVEAGGNIVIPSFAVERSQEIMYCLNQFLIDNITPHLLVFIDSPMAVNVTDVFEKHPYLFDGEMRELIRQKNSPFDFRGLKLVRSVEESKGINRIKGSVIIIAGSGMCTGGRIKHHLVTNISRPESTILFVGYQARGTLGRLIVEGIKEVRILGQKYPVRAQIKQVNGFSAHADKDQLLKWVSSLKKPPRNIFVTHGESDVSLGFADLLREKTGWNVSVPEYRDEVILD